MASDWKEYQEDAATFFRSLGLSAETNVTLKGVRTSHAIDVVVKSRQFSFEILWLVECKQWKNPVTKLHVLALREIVNDLGADRGILLCEVGFQAGAIEAANLTNVQVTSLASLSIEACQDISAMRLREFYDRIENCNDRYWDLPKDFRKLTGLRPDFMEIGYSGAKVIDFCRQLLSHAFRGNYPIDTDHLMMGAFMPFVRPGLPSCYPNIGTVVEVIESLTVELEGKLDTAYATLSHDD